MSSLDMTGFAKEGDLVYESKSMKLRNIVKIKNNIMYAIANDEQIKRYIMYLTKEPLSQSFKDENGNIVEQSNVEESIIFEEKRVFPNSFNNSILDKAKNLIFIYNYDGNLSDIALAKNTIVIDIITFSDCEYNLLADLETRDFAIAYRIIDIIEDEKNSFGGIGKPRVVHYKAGKITNKDKEYNCLSLFVEVSTSNLR